MDTEYGILDFGYTEDKTLNLIKVIGVGGGGCNAVSNMYSEGIVNVTFAICDTDSQRLAGSGIPVKIQLGASGLGAGANPEAGQMEAEQTAHDIERLLSDGTKMVFVTAGMGGGTGTGAAPVVAGIAKSLGILTIGIVTIPFFFEKKRKIIKAIKGVERMRENVDALLIINNERICDVYNDSKISIKEAFKRADGILLNATKSISELITVGGEINLDFRDVETTLRGGGGAIMAMGRASGERRVENAILNALDSPLLYGSDIDRAKRILFNIYTSPDVPLLVDEMNEVDAFMDTLDPNIDVIWGVSDDESLDDDAKVTILATGMDEEPVLQEMPLETKDEDYYEQIITKLYKPVRKRMANENPSAALRSVDAALTDTQASEPPFIVEAAPEPEPAVSEPEPDEPEVETVVPAPENGVTVPSLGVESVSSTASVSGQDARKLTFVERLKTRLSKGIGGFSEKIWEVPGE